MVMFLGPYEVGMGMNAFRGQGPPPRSPSWADNGIGMEGAPNTNRCVVTLDVTGVFY